MIGSFICCNTSVVYHYRIRRTSFDSHQDKHFILRKHCIRPNRGSTQPPIWWVQLHLLWGQGGWSYRRLKCLSCRPSSFMERGTEKAVNRISQLPLESKFEYPKRGRHFTNRTIPALTKRMATRCCRTLLRALTDCRSFWRQERRQNVRDGNCSGT
jgi:hypothetical protein